MWSFNSGWLKANSWWRKIIPFDWSWLCFPGKVEKILSFMRVIHFNTTIVDFQFRKPAGRRIFIDICWHFSKTNKSLQTIIVALRFLKSSHMMNFYIVWRIVLFESWWSVGVRIVLRFSFQRLFFLLGSASWFFLVTPWRMGIEERLSFKKTDQTSIIVWHYYCKW